VSFGRTEVALLVKRVAEEREHSLKKPAEGWLAAPTWRSAPALPQPIDRVGLAQ
jgi:hypothetical protein